MKATKKQIAEVSQKAAEMNFSVELALATLEKTSASIYNAIGAQGVVESSIRANSSDFVNTLERNIQGSMSHILAKRNGTIN